MPVITQLCIQPFHKWAKGRWFYTWADHITFKKKWLSSRIFCSYNWQRKKSFNKSISSCHNLPINNFFFFFVFFIAFQSHNFKFFFLGVFFCLVDQRILSFSAVCNTISSSSSLLVFQCHNLKSGWNWAFGVSTENFSFMTNFSSLCCLCSPCSSSSCLYSSSSSIVFHGSLRLKTTSCSSSSLLQSLSRVTCSHGRLTSENSRELAVKKSSDDDDVSSAAAAADRHHHMQQRFVSSTQQQLPLLLSETKSIKPVRFVSKDFTPTNERRTKKNLQKQADSQHHHQASPLFATASVNAVIAAEGGEERLSKFQNLDWKGRALVLLLLGSGIVGVIWASKKVFTRVHEKVSGGGAEEDGGGAADGSSSPLSIVAKGFSTVQKNLGPWSFQDLTLGLAAISKVTEKDPPKPPGKLAKDTLNDPHFLALAQHWRAMAEAAYVFDPASFSLQSHLPESAIVAAEWTPNQETLRPAYVVCIDAPYGAVVLSVRGTSQVVDMLVNSGASAEPFMGGEAHGGFVHATEKLIEEAVPLIKKAFAVHGKAQKNLKLVIVGHSMGAAVGIMAGMKLKHVFPNLECWGYSTPACVSLDLASGSCKSYVTSFLANHDIVPRFSVASVELLRQRIFDFNWEEGDRIAHGDEDWEKIKVGADSLRQVQQKQNDISESVQQAQEGVSEKVQDVNKKMASPLPGSEEEDGENGSEKKGKEEEKREHPPMYPPGRLLVLASEPPGCGKSPEQRSNVPQQRNMGTYPTFEEARNVKWEMYEAKQEEIGELVVSPWCVSDHMLGNLAEGIAYLQSQCEPAFSGMPK